MQVNFNALKYQPIKIKTNRAKIDTMDFFETKNDSVQISFKASKYCSTSAFEVKTLENLRCPVCGLVMLTNDQISAFVNDVAAKRGEALIDALEKYQDESVITGRVSEDTSGCGIYRPYKKEIVDLYVELAKQFPNLDLLGLTKYQAKKCIDELITEQMVVVRELETYIGNAYQGEEKDELLKKLKGYIEQINGKKNAEVFSRKRFIFGMKKGLDDVHAAEMDLITTKMPTSENDINSFFVHYQRAANSKEIAKKLVQQTKPTVEHVVPKAFGGSDSYANYFCDCEECNNRRGTTSFYEWYQTIPGFPNRLQEYINVVQMAIDEDRFEDPKLGGYIESFVETILKVSEGELVLEVPEVKNPARRVKVIQKRKSKIEELQRKHGSLLSFRNQIKEEVEKLQSYEHFDLIDRYRKNLEELAKINQESTENEREKNRISALLDKAKGELQRISADLSNKKPAKKTNLEQKFERKKEIVAQYESQIARLKYRNEELVRRKINLRVQNRFAVSKEEELTRKFEALRDVKLKIEELQRKIAKFESVDLKETSLTTKIDELNVRIAELESKNNVILTLDGFNPNNTSAYEEYLEQKDLLRTGQKIEYKKSSVNNVLAVKFIELGKAAARAEIERLEKLAGVQYFINLKEIEALTKERDQSQARLVEILEANRQIKTLKEQVEALCAGKTIQQIQQEYEVLLNEKRIISEIHQIQVKLDKLSCLNQVISANEGYFKKLEQYETLTNSEYSELISFINVQVVF